MVMVLKSAGHTVKAVQDGELALKAAQEEDFDMIITDLSMPKLDGLGLVKETKAKNPGQVVVLLTGYAEEGALPPNVDYVLSKPVKIDALSELVARIANR